MCLPFVHEKLNILAEHYLLQHAIMYTQKQRKRKGAIAHEQDGGAHVHFGKNVYANFNLTVVDDTHIYVGDGTMFGPNVTLATAGHPIDPELRAATYQYNMAIHIGKNCWLGAGVIVLPGITIGDNVVIGAGSAVTKDLPDNVIAVGNPCHVLRPVSEHDREYYFKNRKIDRETL